MRAHCDGRFIDTEAREVAKEPDKNCVTKLY